MIESDAVGGFYSPVSDGANVMEVLMPLWVMRPHREARQAHPNAAKLLPMVFIRDDP